MHCPEYGQTVNRAHQEPRARAATSPARYDDYSEATYIIMPRPARVFRASTQQSAEFLAQPPALQPAKLNAALTWHCQECSLGRLQRQRRWENAQEGPA